MKRYFGILMIMAFAAFVLGIAPNASARLILTLDDLAIPGPLPEVIVIDDFDGGGGTVADTQLGDGVIGYSGTIGAGVFTVNITSGISKPIVGPDPWVIHLDSVNVSGTGAGTLEIQLTDTDFIAPLNSPNIALISSMGGVTDGTVTLTQHLDLLNAEFGPGPPTVILPPAGPGAFSASDVSGLVPIVPGSLFSMTEVATIDHFAAGDLTSFDAESTPIPEPGTLLLLGSGLVGLGGYARLRLRKKKKH